MGAILKPNFSTHLKPAQYNFLYPFTAKIKIKISKEFAEFWAEIGLRSDLAQVIVFSMKSEEISRENAWP